MTIMQKLPDVDSTMFDSASRSRSSLNSDHAVVKRTLRCMSAYLLSGVLDDRDGTPAVSRNARRWLTRFVE